MYMFRNIFTTDITVFDNLSGSLLTPYNTTFKEGLHVKIGKSYFSPLQLHHSFSLLAIYEISCILMR